VGALPAGPGKSLRPPTPRFIVKLPIPLHRLV
jgi:hypothetical protein